MPSLLEKVLEKTLDVGESTEALDSATRTSLLNFARQNGSDGGFFGIALGNLVQIVLRQEMALLAGQPGWNRNFRSSGAFDLGRPRRARTDLQPLATLARTDDMSAEIPDRARLVEECQGLVRTLAQQVRGKSPAVTWNWTT